MTGQAGDGRVINTGAGRSWMIHMMSDVNTAPAAAAAAAMDATI